MHTLLNVGAVYLAFVALFFGTEQLIGVSFNAVTLLISPAVVASFFCVTCLSKA
ncbi:MAG TPA: hypothetical protein VK558_11225 [Patescibacteria group bacterium]|nr:hypothetical protein [Patescibacteria group bacterium]